MIFDNLQCVTVAPNASGFSRTLLVFVLLDEELVVHARYGLRDHVERLVLRIQSPVPLFFHVLLSVLQNDSENLDILVSS